LGLHPAALTQRVYLFMQVLVLGFVGFGGVGAGVVVAFFVVGSGLGGVVLTVVVGLGGVVVAFAVVASVALASGLAGSAGFSTASSTGKAFGFSG